MKARKLVAELPGGKKAPMSELVPLGTPLLLQIFPIYACNFKCKYCTLSIPKKERGFISDKITMEPNLFKKCINDCKRFPDKIRVLRFVGMGEPLMHNALPEMIKYASDANIFERIEIITNASLLTPSLSHQLATSGLTKLLISIQGTSAEKYREISQVNINFDNFVDNIRNFYEHKGEVEVHIKIADCALDDEEDEQKFYNIFGDICDTIAIEYIGPIHDGVEYNKHITAQCVNQYGEEIVECNICSQPFYLMQINPDGNIVPCHALTYPQIMGNAYRESIYDVWYGTNYRTFNYNMLDGVSNIGYPCSTCKIFTHRCSTNDDLFLKVEELKYFYRQYII